MKLLPVAGLLSPAAAPPSHVDRTLGHRAFTTGEMLAAVERRVGSGHWPDTGPAALNAAAARLDPTATSAYPSYRPSPYPRPFDLARAPWAMPAFAPPDAGIPVPPA